MYQEKQLSVKKIHQMLMEMADGNFSYRLPLDNKNDKLKGISILINWLAEEMEESIFHNGYINPHLSYRFAIQSTYIIDYDGIIHDFSPEVPHLLNMEANKLRGLNFSIILEENSIYPWKITKKKFLDNEIHQASLLLKFITSKKLLIPAVCSMVRLLQKEKLIVSFFTMEKNEVESTLLKNNKGQEIKTQPRIDTQLIQSVYDYILSHKNTSLPTLKELARLFGTNEFKLKVGFKHLFKTTIYQLYTDQRLKKAYLCIQHTAMPLKEIAIISGYNTYSNFSRAFKHKYGSTPRAIIRDHE